MECVAPVPEQVVQLRRVIADEDVEPVILDDRADGVHTWTAVLADRRHVTETHGELIDHRAPDLGQLGSLSSELAPALHTLILPGSRG